MKRMNELARGLTTEEARARLAADGPNEIAPPKRISRLRELAAPLANPLVMLLLAATVVSAALGDFTNAAIVFVIIVLGATLDVVQTLRSRRAIERLRSGVAPRAVVGRDGIWITVPRTDLVVGDVVRLVAGDLVPADAELVSSKHLHVQEAALTGESLPVDKTTNGAGTEGQVFLGTSVVSGTGVARVTATGKRTRFGDIARRLAQRAPETAFDRGVRDFGMLVLRTVVLLSFAIVLARIAARRDAVESMLFALALAVGLTPEFLPMISAVTLARGAARIGARTWSSKSSAPSRTSGAPTSFAPTRRARSRPARCA
jgi:Mg2+-importing ATPase